LSGQGQPVRKYNTSALAAEKACRDEDDRTRISFIVESHSFRSE